MLVSIITPSLNQGAFIEDTINSVLNQDYRDLQYIVVDGGSSDETLDILRKYDDRITWFSEPDNGQADAINKGIRMSEGEIIAWLNSDDILLTGAIGKVVDCFGEHPEAAMVYGKSHFIDTDGNIIGTYPTEPFDFQRLAMFNFICQPSTFFKKDAFDEVDGLDKNLHYAFDLDLWIKLAKKIGAKYLPEFLSGYRLHDTSKTMDNVHALQNQKEGLDVARRHYKWAPLNRVYGYCYQLIEGKLTRTVLNFRPLTIALSLLFAIAKYLQLNKGIRCADIKAFNKENLGKLCVPWESLYQTY